MAWRPRTWLLTGLLSGATLALHAQDPRPSQATATAAALVPHPPQHFEGLWVYNPDESVNAATGRPEQAPRSATQRTPGGRSGGANAPARPTQPWGSGGDRFTGFRNSPGETGPTVAMIQENRSLTRDLMEVPEELTIKVSSEAVTFVDDLERERTYSTTGERQRLQIGAARFNAATFWTGSQLEKRIDAADGFRMTEIYFLSADARRMFVILRVGSNRKGAPVMGVNRVYDRRN